MVVGLSLLVTTSGTAVRLARRVRTRAPWLDARILAVEHRISGRFGRALRRTGGHHAKAVAARLARRRPGE